MKNPTARSRRALPIVRSDIQGLARLGIDAFVGLTDLVEAMHHTIGNRPDVFGTAPTGRTSGVTGTVYQTIRGTSRLIGGALDALLGVLSRVTKEADVSPERKTVHQECNSGI